MHNNSLFRISGLTLSLLTAGLTACTSTDKAQVKTPADVIASADSEGKNSTKKSTYKPLTGRMDGVEFYINKDLASNGLDGDREELKSIFDDHHKTWNPQKGFNLPVVRNAQVDRWINTFTGTLRTNFERWIRRGSHYVPIMEPILKEYGVPTDLIYLSMIESGFNTHAYSHAHAAGLWQFIPGTGRMYGLEAGKMIDERRDIVKATRAAAAHLRDLYKMYGDWYLAFAAYNAGPGTVNRALRVEGKKNFWALAASKKRVFRQETKDYVPKVLAAAIIMKNYKKYGFSSSLLERPLKADEIQIADATDLSVLADCANVSFEEMKYLNPSLLGCVTPAGRNYTVYLPEGTANTFQKNYARLSPRDRVRLVSHKVKKNETWATIAKHYKVDTGTIVAMNGLSSKSAPKVGTILRIPRAGSSKSFLAKAKNEAPVVAMAETAPLTSKGSSLDEESQSEDAVNEIVNAALDQDGKAAAQPASQPASHDADAPGVPELVPDVTAQDDSAPAGGKVAVRQPGKTYKVKKGDTLAGIAKKNGVTMAQIRKLNGMGAKSVIKVGQVVKVTSPKTIYRDAPALAVAPKAADVPVAQLTAPVVAEASPAVADLDGSVVATAPQAVVPEDVAPVKQVAVAPAPKVVVASKPAAKSTYKVQAGDTLDQIARKNGTTVTALMKANGFAVSSIIRPGQTIKLNGKSAVPSAKEKLVIHAVRKGETLWTLSRKYGVTVTQIKNWNKLNANGIQPNQKIRIYVQSGAPAKKMASL